MESLQPTEPTEDETTLDTYWDMTEASWRYKLVYNYKTFYGDREWAQRIAEHYGIDVPTTPTSSSTRRKLVDAAMSGIVE